MATGRSNQLTKQVGEYLVAAELCRRGLIAATFSGSVPDYDIIAADSVGRSVFVQVKAVNGGSWQFDIRRFVDVQLDGKKQVMGARVTPTADIVFVMVALEKYGADRFYVLSWKELQNLLVTGHRRMLARCEGVRPRKFDSFHCAIGEGELLPFKDKWVAQLRDRYKLRVDEPGA